MSGSPALVLVTHDDTLAARCDRRLRMDGGRLEIAVNALGQLRFAFRSIARGRAAGELRVLALALIVAVASVTAVGFFTDRIGRAVERQAADVLAADMFATSGFELPSELESEARSRALATARHTRFQASSSATPTSPSSSRSRRSPTVIRFAGRSASPRSTRRATSRRSPVLPSRARRPMPGGGAGTRRPLRAPSGSIRNSSRPSRSSRETR